VSRALGDADYKGARTQHGDWAWPVDRPADQRHFTDELVLAVPDIRHANLQDAHARASEAPDAPVPFMVLACDGLWEVMSSMEAVDLAAEYMRARGYGSLSSVRGGKGAAGGAGGGSGAGAGTEHVPTGAARRLVEMALKLGTSDNVTVMVVMLPPPA
jgi:serine/threonine protein phosphatase PrpC